MLKLPSRYETLAIAVKYNMKVDVNVLCPRIFLLDSFNLLQTFCLAVEKRKTIIIEAIFIIIFAYFSLLYWHELGCD